MTNVTPLNILLAEDNEDHAELIIDTLESFNISNRIVHVTNGEEVLDLLERSINNPSLQPNLILLDLKMPRMDGITTLKHIRQMAAFKTIPVIMVSTSSIDIDIESCYAMGANSYITKPLQFEEFTRKIRELNLYWVLTSEIPGKRQ